MRPNTQFSFVGIVRRVGQASKNLRPKQASRCPVNRVCFANIADDGYAEAITFDLEVNGPVYQARVRIILIARFGHERHAEIAMTIFLRHTQEIYAAAIGKVRRGFPSAIIPEHSDLSSERIGR